MNQTFTTATHTHLHTNCMLKIHPTLWNKHISQTIIYQLREQCFQMEYVFCGMFLSYDKNYRHWREVNNGKFEGKIVK